MTITKANVVAKTDAAVSATPLANKIVAADVNELKRASDDTIDAIEGAEYGGLFICEGTGTQTIDIASSPGQITVNQWTTAQPDNGIGVENGDQTITIPRAGIYKVEVHYSYDTDSKNDEVFKFFAYADGIPIAGVCTRAQHYRSSDSVYSAKTGRLVAFSGGEVLTARVDGVGLSQNRTFDIKHGAFTVYRIGV